MHLLLPLLPKLPLRLPSTALVEPEDSGPVDWEPEDWGPVDWGPEDWELVDWGLVERSLVL